MPRDIRQMENTLKVENYSNMFFFGILLPKNALFTGVYLEFALFLDPLLDEALPALPLDILPGHVLHLASVLGYVSYRAFHKLPQIYTANHATFPIQMYAIRV